MLNEDEATRDFVEHQPIQLLEVNGATLATGSVEVFGRPSSGRGRSVFRDEKVVRARTRRSKRQRAAVGSRQERIP